MALVPIDQFGPPALSNLLSIAQYAYNNQDQIRSAVKRLVRSDLNKHIPERIAYEQSQLALAKPLLLPAPGHNYGIPQPLHRHGNMVKLGKGAVKAMRAIVQQKAHAKAKGKKGKGKGKKGKKGGKKGGKDNMRVISANRGGIRIKFSEFLSDISGSTLFVNKPININPIDPNFAPWLSGIAPQYAEYLIHSCKFRFKSTSANALNSTNTALGTVMMATDYDPINNAFSSKLQMENYIGARSAKPSTSFSHIVDVKQRESPLTHLYCQQSVENAASQTADPRFSVFGVFQLATVGMQAAAVIGELHVDYDIEFFKPNLENSTGGVTTGFVGASLGALSTFTNLFGSSGSVFSNLVRTSGYQSGFNSNPDCFSFQNNVISFGKNTVGGNYLVQLLFNQSSGSVSSLVCTNSAGLTLIDNAYYFPADAGISGGSAAPQGHFCSTFYNNGGQTQPTLTFTVSGTQPISNLWCLVTEIAYLTGLGQAAEPSTRQKDPLYLMQKEMEQMRLEYRESIRELKSRVVFHDEDEDFPIVRVEEVKDEQSSSSNQNVTLTQSMVRTLLGATSQAK